MTTAQLASLVMAGTAMLTTAAHLITSLTGLVRRVSQLEAQLAALGAQAPAGPPTASPAVGGPVAAPVSPGGR